MSSKQSANSNRRYFTEEQKHQIAADVLALRITFAEAIKKYELQGYQLEQWIGKCALQQAREASKGSVEGPSRAPSSVAPQSDDSQAIASLSDEALNRIVESVAIREWTRRNRA